MEIFGRASSTQPGQQRDVRYWTVALSMGVIELIILRQPIDIASVPIFFPVIFSSSGRVFDVRRKLLAELSNRDNFCFVNVVGPRENCFSSD